ncbi:YqzK family protein [Bacillus cellulosilyticus]|uniref:DUF4227 family protein n=1 Tax=Evansella cellulosilytica (strain ATCC 21833 / DSM 2522 / FERM P-1141 / JCM 9156 / N-4) TaxID=649639 RepID=E6TYJ8_EVAC2|nr:hypothetical protein Bcell_1786 [Evansella cellulosilytica DSM 2522]
MRGLRVIFDAVWVFFVFMGCTLVFYYGILWVSEEYNDYHRYDEPEGRAVKVVHQPNIEDSTQLPLSRLSYFLINGE